MISTSAWVPCGLAAADPRKSEITAEEFERIKALAQLELDDAKLGLSNAYDSTYD